MIIIIIFHYDDVYYNPNHWCFLLLGLAEAMGAGAYS